jgi:hypothetical protein
MEIVDRILRRVLPGKCCAHELVRFWPDFHLNLGGFLICSSGWDLTLRLVVSRPPSYRA